MFGDEKVHEPHLECRDPVHGFVRLSEVEWSIVDCPTFQRLRDIRQLAMAHMVYPGATHTRFEHSLGCLHLSDRIYSALERKVIRCECPDFAQAFRASGELVKRGRRVLRLAALLHDIGHTPFSHTGEQLMPVNPGHESGKRYTHEDVTAKLIRETEIREEIEKGFGDAFVEEVVAVATGPETANLPASANLAWFRFLHDILAGELGSDRMDYLLRDAKHSGQHAGMFDYLKLIDSMIIVPPPQETVDEHRLGLDDGGWLIAEQMVASRYLMYVTLYFHKTKRIYEKHLERFLEAWLEDEFGHAEFPVDDPQRYVGLTDSQVLSAIYREARAPGSKLCKLALPFVDRSHLRLAIELTLSDNHVQQITSELVGRKVKALLGEFDSKVNKESENDRIESIKTAVKELLAFRNDRIWDEKRFDKLVKHAHTYVREKLGPTADLDHDQTKHHAAQFLHAGTKIWVYKDKKTLYLDDLSEIVSGMPSKIWRGRIYASRDIRHDVKCFCNNWLKENPCGGGDTNDQ